MDLVNQKFVREWEALRDKVIRSITCGQGFVIAIGQIIKHTYQNRRENEFKIPMNEFIQESKTNLNSQSP